MQVILLFTLIALPAFFSAVEVSLLRLRPSRVQRLVEDGLAIETDKVVPQSPGSVEEMMLPAWMELFQA